MGQRRGSSCITTEWNFVGFHSVGDKLSRNIGTLMYFFMIIYSILFVAGSKLFYWKATKNPCKGMVILVTWNIMMTFWKCQFKQSPSIGHSVFWKILLTWFVINKYRLPQWTMLVQHPSSTTFWPCRILSYIQKLLKIMYCVRRCLSLVSADVRWTLTRSGLVNLIFRHPIGLQAVVST